MKAPDCPDCAVPMIRGWIPDVTYGAVTSTHWHDGIPEKVSFLGIPAGVKAKPGHLMPVTAWRCPDCGLVRSYAFPRKWKDAGPP